MSSLSFALKSVLDERQSHEGDIRAASGERRAAKPLAASSVGGRVSEEHATRGSRLEYRTRFLAAPPAGILEQKRDCSQSTSLHTAVRTGN